MVVAVGLATSVVVNQSTTRHRAVVARETSLTLDSLLTDRADLYAEYVPTLAIETAKVHKLTGAQLDKLLGVDFQATLVSARQQVDGRPDFGPQGLYAAYRPQLLSLRRSFDQGKASGAEIESFFNGLASKIDARWEATFQNLSSSSEAAGSLILNDRVGAVGTTFSAFTAGLGEENLPPSGSLESLLVTRGTPAEVQGLIVSHEQFETSILGFPAGLGPKATSAWKAHARNPLSTKFRGYVKLAIAVSLGHEKPPFATNAPAIGEIAKSEVEWETSLTSLVLASSADLRAATTDQANSATGTLYLVFFFMLLLILAAVGGVVLLGRAIRRPLARLLVVAESVRAGELDLPELDESGPKELSLAAGAFNEMSATLRAVQTQAIALAAGHLDDPALQSLLPGRTGGALQSALSELQTSVREREAQREVLNERATRDFLTGLLNREAALEALELDLARVRRGGGQLILAVLFIDLDELKKINDSLGHDRGDWALRGLAGALRATTRASDVVARFGGDEFVVGWLGNAGSDGPELLARRIGEYVSRLEVKGDDGSLKLGCSIGVALSEPTDVTVATLIERADQALYVAKGKGRGRVHQLDRALS
jgi:diguanylate cyclase (GGDEF)-like protein